MSKMSELYKELYTDGLIKELKVLIDTGHKEQVLETIDKYTKIIVDRLKDEPFENKVAFMDYTFNSLSFVAVKLLETKDEGLLRAQLVLEKLKGSNIDAIRNDLEKADAFNTLYITMNGKGLSKNEMVKIDNGKKAIKHLNEYLNTLSKEEYEEQIKKDYTDFVLNFQNLEGSMFKKATMNWLPSRTSMIERIFRDFSEEPEVLNSFFENVMEKEEKLEFFNYTGLLEENPDLLGIVRGMINKVEDNYIKDVLIEGFKEASPEDIKEVFDLVEEVNKGDEESLSFFIKRVESYALEEPELEKKLEGQELYLKYRIGNNDKIYEDGVNKLLYGEYDLDPFVLRIIGKTKYFLDNYDQFLQNYINSSDEEYQKALLNPLIVGLLEKQKEKYGLDFKNLFTSHSIETSTLGSFNHKENTMYINTALRDNVKDMKQLLVNAIDTVFHETRHAVQDKEIYGNDDLNYDNLIMAIDTYFFDTKGEGFYYTNYGHYSIERDARETAYAETMAFFRDYPEMQALEKDDFDFNYALSDFIRKEDVFSTETYYSIIHLFMRGVETGLNIDMPGVEDYRVELKEQLDKFPVFKTFFNIDYENRTISLNSVDFFKEKIDKIVESGDRLKCKEAAYAMRALDYSIKVNRFLESDKIFTNHFPEEVSYNEGLIQEVLANAGQTPVR